MSITIDPVIDDQLNRIARRQRRLIGFRAALVALACWIVLILALVVIDAVWVLERGPRTLLTLLAHALAIAVFIGLSLSRVRGQTPLRRAALAVEGARPEMRDRLLSAVELATASARGSVAGSRAFIDAAQRDVASRLGRIEIRELLPVKLLKRPLTIAACLFGVAASLMLIPDLRYGTRLARAIIPGIDLDRVSRTRIEILQPSPASTSVPANEWTAIRITTSGSPATTGNLQWESDSGQRGEIEMQPLDASPTEAASVEAVSQWVCQLPVAEAPLRYRVLAGDGVTAWHRLEPKSRPQVVSFQFQVTPPDYSRLPAETVTTTAGNLKTLRDSVVSLTATFAEPVVEAELRLIDADVRVPMAGEGTQWRVDLKVERDDRYQVVARDAETGFDNSLSPQYQVVAVPDLPPQVTWVESRPGEPSGTGVVAEPPNWMARRLVPSRASLRLAAATEDEMPIEEFFQETAINQGAWVRDLAQPAAPETFTEFAAKHAWAWDLEPLNTEASPLRPGDLIRTRTVAIDRKGQRGESQVREFLISDEAFDARRRDNLRGWVTLADELTNWTAAVQHELERLGLEPPAKPAEESQPADPSQAPEDKPPLTQQTGALIARVQAMNGRVLHDGEAGELEIISRGISRIDAELTQAAAASREPGDWLREALQSATAIGNAARLATAHRLCVTLADDLDRMDRSLSPLVDPDSGILWESFARHHRVTAQQFVEIAALIDELQDKIPDSTRNHNEQLRRWIDGWLRRLEDHVAPEIGEARVRSMTSDLATDISSRKRYGMLDGRLPSLLIESQNRLHDRFGLSSPTVQEVRREAATSPPPTPAADGDAKPAGWPVSAAIAARLTAVSEQLDHDAESNLRRPEADRRYVSDVRLMRRVLETIRGDEFAPPEQRTVPQVLDDISSAFHQLEAGHLWNQWLMELRNLADTERWNIDTASARLDAPQHWDRIQRGLGQALTAMERSGIGWDLRQAVHEQVHDREMSRVSASITARRFQRIPAVSLADDLDAQHGELLSVGESLAPRFAEARRRLESYLPSLGELARDAADSLRRAEEAARQPETPEPRAAAQQLDRLRDEVQAQAETLRQALIDEANTQDLTTATGLARAREADVASRAVEMRMEAAAQATRQAVTQAEQGDPQATAAAIRSAADPLSEAAETLEQIASHYENRDRDEATGQSPLAQLEQDLELQAQLDQEFARSQALADALQSDPKQMLDQLSQELKRNELMRQELQRIAQRSIRDAQQSLEQQAQRERDLRLGLERQDPHLLDEKRRLEDAIRQAVDQSTAVQRSRLHTARQAATKWNAKTLPENLAQTAEQNRQRVEASIEKLQQATQAAATIGAAEQELLQDLKRTAETLRAGLEAAAQTFDEVALSTGVLRQDPTAAIPGDPQKAEQRDMQNLQRQARDTLAGAVRNSQNRANQAVGQSEQIARNAKGQSQQSQRQLAEAQKQLDQKPDDVESERRRDLAAAKVETDRLRETLADEELQRRRQAADQARDSLAEIGRTPLPPLDSARPAGELTESMLRQAATELASSLGALGEATTRVAAATPVRAESAPLAASELTQAEVQGEVGRAAENLQRAARHLERLQDSDAAKPIADVAQSVANVAEQPVAEATKTLAETARRAESQPDFATPADAAAQQLGEAEQAISDQVQALARQLAQMAEANPSEPDGDASDPSGNSANQLARTLDELDRSLTQSRRGQTGQPQPSQQPGAENPSQPAGQPGQPNSDTDSAAQNNNQGQATSGSQSQQAGAGSQAGGQQPSSPTLASAARRQMQQMAMNRTLPGEQAAGDPSSPGPQGENPGGESESSQGQAGTAASSRSGMGSLGNDPDSFRLGEANPRGDSDWGRLRQLESEDTSVQRRIEVSPEYRRQIEAYFRAIAEQGRQP